MNSLEPDASDAQTRTIDAGWLAVAMREAQSMRHGYVGTEHLLLALLLEEGGGARATLEAHGLHAEPLRAELRRMPAEPAFDPPRPATTHATYQGSARSRSRFGSLHSKWPIEIRTSPDRNPRAGGRTGATARSHDSRSISRRARRPPPLASSKPSPLRPTISVLLEAEIPALVAYGEVVRDSSGIDVLQPDFVDRVFETLGRRDRCAALLIGAPSSGKSATARVLAERLARDLDKRMIAISPATLVAGARHRGKLEDRIRAVFDQANSRPRVRTVHRRHRGSHGLARSRRRARTRLSRHHAPLLATTTPRGIETLESLAPTLLAKFEQVAIPARGPETESRLVTALAPALAAHHGISIDAAAIATALRLSRAPRVARAIELARPRVRRSTRADMPAERDRARGLPGIGAARSRSGDLIRRGRRVDRS
jgi:ATP-dependent Clp protease ATP-binding subunit ClpC